MTLVVCLTVNDGVVLAADSATTMIRTQPGGTQEVSNVYNHADKVFNLLRDTHRSCPVGAVTYGAGSIGDSSIATLVKDFRKKVLITGDPLYIDPDNYTVLDVATKFREFMLDDKYTAAFGQLSAKPLLGFIVAGYSTSGSAEQYGIVALDSGQISGPDVLPPSNGSSIYYFGQPEAVDRLMYGIGGGFSQVLVDHFQSTPADASTTTLFFQQMLAVRLENAAMPIQDAIDLAEFLVDLTAKYIRFNEGAQTVGGPIEIATITKHEDFKWVKRKHFYKREFQPDLGA
jgi:hypothetical protein